MNIITHVNHECHSQEDRIQATAIWKLDFLGIFATNCKRLYYTKLTNKKADT